MSDTVGLGIATYNEESYNKMIRQQIWRANCPPGPKGLPIIGNTLQFAHDPLGFPVQCARDYGDLVYLHIRGLNTYLLTNPNAIEHVLVKNHHLYTIDRLSQGLSDALGNSLLVSEGVFWERQRRLVQPAFHKNQLPNYAKMIVQCIQNRISYWKPNQCINIYREMTVVMLSIIAKILLNYDVDDTKANVIESFLNTAMRYVLGIAKSGLRVPWYIPTPGNIACRRAMKELDDIIYTLIHKQRKNNTDTSNLLSMLLHAQDDNGERMTDRQVRDEILTMILVGHETSALAMTYACWLLGLYPQVLHQLCAEVDSVLNRRAATFDDIKTLHYAEWIFNETLRLYPPVWALGREALQEHEINGYLIPVGGQILLSPWVSHRNPRFFNDAETFIPERWNKPDALPRFAYFPFGGGARLCLGNRLAKMEAVLILATIAQHYRLVAMPGYQLELLPTITLRPKNEVPLIVISR